MIEYSLSSIDLELDINKLLDEYSPNEIIQKIKEIAYSLHDEIELKLYIQNHQTALIELKQKHINESVCDEILSYIENSFPRHIDIGCKVS